MTDHKFEPGQLVLVRNSDEHKWRLLHYSHFRNSADEHFFATIGERDYRYCLPFNDDTKHLQNTTLPYEPTVDESKRFEAGEMVEIRGEHMWCSAVYLEYEQKIKLHKVYDLEEHDFYCQPPDLIRPLPDDTAAH